MTQPGPWILRWLKPRKIFLNDGQLPLTDLGFLARHAHSVRELHVVGDGPVDIDALHALAQLRSLTLIADETTTPLRLECLPKLSRLRVTGSVIVDFAGAEALRDVSLLNAGQQLVEAAGQLPQLGELSLTDSWVPDEMSAPVERLTIAYPSRMPERITGLGALAQLILDDFPGGDLSAFEEAGELMELDITDAAQLTSLTGIRLGVDAELRLVNCPQLTDLAEAAAAAERTIVDCPRLT